MKTLNVFPDELATRLQNPCLSLLSDSLPPLPPPSPLLAEETEFSFSLIFLFFSGWVLLFSKMLLSNSELVPVL